MNNSEKFDEQLQDLAWFAKILSHPARLAILKYLSSSKTCLSKDISTNLPLGCTTVSQHLKELKNSGMIKSQTEGLKINYCLNPNEIKRNLDIFELFFKQIRKKH